MKCYICGKEYHNKGISHHITKLHKITVKEYYDKYLKKDGEGICPTCGKETQFLEITTGYRKFCCPRCAQLNKETREKYKATCLEKYGVENPYQSEENKKKIRETNLKRLGVEYPGQSKKCVDKRKQTCLANYGDINYNNREQAVKTMQIGGKRSSLESYLESFFIDNNINFKYEYKESRYPYRCDFYLPDTDTFIEINGYWTHGDHFFDKNNLEDIKTLNKWKKLSTEDNQYRIAIYTWTMKDLEKIKTAKENNLNYVVLWNKDDIENYKMELLKIYSPNRI